MRLYSEESSHNTFRGGSSAFKAGRSECAAAHPREGSGYHLCGPALRVTDSPRYSECAPRREICHGQYADHSGIFTGYGFLLSGRYRP